jgi:hypothetical protein
MKRQLLIMALALSLTTIIADNPISIESLANEKTNLTVNDYFPSIYASELIEKYPQIQSISIERYGQTYGYLNILGGIGTNLLIEPYETYEIQSNETITIELN